MDPGRERLPRPTRAQPARGGGPGTYGKPFLPLFQFTQPGSGPARHDYRFAALKIARDLILSCAVWAPCE